MNGPITHPVALSGTQGSNVPVSITHSHQVPLTSLPHLFSNWAMASAPSLRPRPQPPVCGINFSGLILKDTSDSIAFLFRILQCLPVYPRIMSKPIHRDLRTIQYVLAPAYLSSLGFQHLHPLQTPDPTVLNELQTPDPTVLNELSAVSAICCSLSHPWTFARAVPPTLSLAGLYSNFRSLISSFS